MRRITTVTVLSVAGVLVAAGAAAALNAQVLGGREGPRVGSVDTLLPEEFVSPDAQLTTVPAEPTESADPTETVEPSETPEPTASGSDDDEATSAPSRTSSRTARPSSSSTTEPGDDKGGDSGNSGSGSSGSGGGSDDDPSDDPSDD